MFARPPASTLPPSAPSGAGVAAQSAWRALRANPAVAAAAVAAAFGLGLALVLLVAGDPHAGAPSVRVRLADPPRMTPALRGALPPAPDAPAPAGAADPASGEAVITLPEGGRLGDRPGGAPADGAGPADAAPARPAGPPLPAAPLAGLTAPGPGGLLPVIAKDGRTPFAAYARPFVTTGKPRIALIVGGLGLNAAATRAAIARLPAEVTLSFVPYADGLQGWIDQARAAGHETVLEAPMEPVDYPNNDPGPYTLLAQAPPGETGRRLDWLLSRATGYFALTNYLGGRFMASDGAMSGFMGALKARGLGFVDDGSGARRGQGSGAPRASADTVIDQDLSGEAVDRQLAALEAAALARGGALGAGFAYPVTVERIGRWATGLTARGYQLAPVSAMMRR